MNKRIGHSATDGNTKASGERASGFTLIELLVVIAIISLLVTILMPSLQKAKQLARNTMCCTNLNGIGKAMYYYIEEFEGTFPTWQQTPMKDVTPPTDWSYWYNHLALALRWTKKWTVYEPWTNDPTISENDPEYERPGLFFCPMTDTTLVDIGRSGGDGWGMTTPHPAGWWGREHLSYGYSFALGDSGTNSTNDDCTWTKIADVMRPHEKVMVGDSNNLLMRDSLLQPAMADEAGLGFRHSDGANIVFVDGHVGWEDPYKIQASWTMGSGFPHPLADEHLLHKYWYPKSQ